jgi:peptidyl-prolyl cis-trans isomerase SurA
MFKILPLVYLFIVLFTSNTSYANDNYKIMVKVNDEIITNHDITKEKSYLSALNPTILNIPENEITKIAKQSLIREIIKEKEVLKYYDENYDSPGLSQLAKNLYKKLNINSQEEFKTYLEKYDLKIKDVLKKLAIENNWNTLIYQKYKDQIDIDKDKIKKNLELESSITKIEKLFLLSEIVFTVKNKKEYDDTYKKIVKTIKEEDFRSAATIYSLSDTAKFGGEIGWVGKSDISKEIYKKISNLKINEFTKPFKIGTGFLLINLDDVKEEERENNIEEKYNSLVTKELNRQLNQYSTIYYKKIEKQSFIYEY